MSPPVSTSYRSNQLPVNIGCQSNLLPVKLDTGQNQVPVKICYQLAIKISSPSKSARCAKFCANTGKDQLATTFLWFIQVISCINLLTNINGAYSTKKDKYIHVYVIRTMLPDCYVLPQAHRSFPIGRPSLRPDSVHFQKIPAIKDRNVLSHGVIKIHGSWRSKKRIVRQKSTSRLGIGGALMWGVDGELAFQEHSG